MFRDCYFTYAGQYSGDYELVMSYVENSYEKFPSGGDYEAATDTLPATAETLLYGIKHSEKPLEFSIEITNLNEAIPFERMKEIKEWLFGQNGWKKLTLQSPDYNGCHLKCLLIPDEDIVDATGYKGLRCTLKNASAYWYGDEKTIKFTKDDLIKLAGENRENLEADGYLTVMVNIDSQSPVRVNPIIEFLPPIYSGGSHSGATYFYCDLINNSNSVLSGLSLGVELGSMKETFNINCRYGLLNFKYSYSMYKDGYDMFYFIKGNNNIKIKLIDYDGNFAPYEYISFTYTPTYRIGGF